MIIDAITTDVAAALLTGKATADPCGRSSFAPVNVMERFGIPALWDRPPELGAHYLGKPGFHPVICFATREQDAVAVYGPPCAASFHRVLNKPLELTRLWQQEGVDRQASVFLSSTLKHVGKLLPECDGVVSYADPAKGHSGTLYAACNFLFAGECSNHSTDHWQAPDGTLWNSHDTYREFRTKGPKRMAALRPDWRFIAGKPKLLFVYGLKLTSAEMVKRIRPAPTERRRTMTQGGGLRVSVYQEKFPAKRCANCRQLFAPRHAGQMVCGGTCRVALHRKRKRAATS